MPLADVHGLEMYYEPHGSGAPLLLIGGLGLDVSEMGALTGPLADRFRVIALDNRGTGRTAKPRGPCTVEQMAGDTAGLMDQLDLASAHVLGISLGGRIALALALAQPQRVNRLVLVSTSPRAAGGSARKLVRLGMLAANLPVLRGQYRQPRYAMRAQFDATTRFDCTDRLGEIRAPTLIVHGKSDRVAPVAFAAEMHRSIPGSQLILVDGGHLFSLRAHSGQFVANVTAFLSADGGPLAYDHLC
jgi:3-oxoadipate enol-lactonase